jgi:hypothetical protein
MIKSELLQKIETIIDAGIAERMFGTIEVEMRDGKLVLLRTVKTEKLEDRGEYRHATNQNRN